MGRVCQLTSQRQKMLWQNQLLAAIQHGDLNRVKEVCEKSKRLAHGTYKDGSRPLHWACKVGSIEIVQNLIDEQSVDVNVKDHSGATPLDWASRHHGKSHEIVRYLIQEKGASFSGSSSIINDENLEEEKNKLARTTTDATTLDDDNGGGT